jgi:carboxypeptidase D
MNDLLIFPPAGPFPNPPSVTTGCDLWQDIKTAATAKNPCFNIYHVATTCPLLWDVLGFPGSFEYLPEGAEIYFNRQDVQDAINAPRTTWTECSGGVFVGGVDNSLPSAFTVLPSVIERLNRTIIGQGLLDYIIIANGTLLAIQNMTWNGEQGFSAEPSEPLIVPVHWEPSLSTLAGSGIMGRWRTERGLTYSTVNLAGHMVPQYAPSASYRQVQFLLGRITSLSDPSPFTTAQGSFDEYKMMTIIAPEDLES